MEFEYLESQTTNHTTFMYDTIYFQAPDEDDEPVEGDWDDEEDEDFDDQTESRNDLHEIQVDDDLNEPDGEQYDITHPNPEDDHLPEEELQ